MTILQLKFSDSTIETLRLTKMERYIIKDNNTLVGHASILKSARKIVESGDVMMVPLSPIEDVTEEASTSSIRQGWHEESQMPRCCRPPPAPRGKHLQS